MNNLDEINNSQLIAICRGAAQRCDDQHGYMELASSDPHGWLPNQWVIDAMRDLLRINSEEVAQLRAENKALTSYKAENERLERNRDMWKGQVERQAEELTTLRKDAERYRRMRAMTLAQTGDAPDEFDSAFDSQLDAALGHGEQS